MKTTNGPYLTYEIVFRMLPRQVFQFKPDGFFHPIGYKRGILIRSYQPIGGVMYLLPEDYLIWKHEAEKAG